MYEESNRAQPMNLWCTVPPGYVRIGSSSTSKVKPKSKIKISLEAGWNKNLNDQIPLPYIHVPIDLFFLFRNPDPFIKQSPPNHGLVRCSYQHPLEPQHQPSVQALSCSIRFCPKTQVSAFFPLASHGTGEYDTTHFFTAQSTARYAMAKGGTQ